jgi:hypothetical protein
MCLTSVGILGFQAEEDVNHHSRVRIDGHLVLMPRRSVGVLTALGRHRRDPLTSYSPALLSSLFFYCIRDFQSRLF